jgi:two-component system, NarL family, response regulator LiaR
VAKPISILIVDDHFVVRKGLHALLAEHEDVVVLGEAADGREAVARAAELSPDVVLMDILLPELDGIAATRTILARRPATRVVTLTNAADSGKLVEMVRAGALGYVPKSAGPAELLAAIRKVHGGEPWLPVALTLRLLETWNRGPAAPEEGLTEREGELLRLVARGLSNHEIAARARITEATVRTHLTHVFAKLGVSNRVEATLFALRHGWTTLEESLVTAPPAPGAAGAARGSSRSPAAPLVAR